MKNVDVMRKKIVDYIGGLKGSELLELTDLLAGTKYECNLYECEICKSKFGDCTEEMREVDTEICDSRFRAFCDMESGIL